MTHNAPSAYEIRPLTTLEDCRKVAELERVVWGYTDAEDVVPPPVLIVSIKRGGILLEDMDPTALAQLRSMLLAMDPPRHQHHRKPLTVPFGKPQIATLEKRVRDICRDILATVPDGATVDLVDDVASSLPTRVLIALACFVLVPENAFAANSKTLVLEENVVVEDFEKWIRRKRRGRKEPVAQAAH